MISLWIKLGRIILIVLLLSSFDPISLSIPLAPRLSGTPRGLMLIASTGHLIPDLEVNHLRIVLVIPAPPLLLVAILVD